MEYTEVVGEEGHSLGRQVEFEMGKLFHKKPHIAEYTLYSKGVIGEQWAGRLNKEQTVRLEQGGESKMTEISNKHSLEMFTENS